MPEKDVQESIFGAMGPPKNQPLVEKSPNLVRRFLGIFPSEEGNFSEQPTESSGQLESEFCAENSSGDHVGPKRPISGQKSVGKDMGTENGTCGGRKGPKTAKKTPKTSSMAAPKFATDFGARRGRQRSKVIKTSPKSSKKDHSSAVFKREGVEGQKGPRWARKGLQSSSSAVFEKSRAGPTFPFERDPPRGQTGPKRAETTPMTLGKGPKIAMAIFPQELSTQGGPPGPKSAENPHETKQKVQPSEVSDRISTQKSCQNFSVSTKGEVCEEKKAQNVQSRHLSPHLRDLECGEVTMTPLPTTTWFQTMVFQALKAQKKSKMDFPQISWVLAKTFKVYKFQKLQSLPKIGQTSPFLEKKVEG